MECCGVCICEPGHHLSVCLLGLGGVASSHCQKHKWALESWLHPSEWDGFKARGEDIRRRCVEEGRVEYVPVAPPALGPPEPIKIRFSSSKRKIKVTRSPVKLPRRFEVSSPPASPSKRSLVKDPSFASTLGAPASRAKSRRSGRDRRAAPVFQMGFP